MTDLKVGDVIELPVGLKVYHNQAQEVLSIGKPVQVVVENSRKIIPFQVTGSEAHFEECFMIKARALNPDGSYHPEGALLTIAQYGDFHPDYILPNTPNMVLRRMKRVYVPVT